MATGLRQANGDGADHRPFPRTSLLVHEQPPQATSLLIGGHIRGNEKCRPNHPPVGMDVIHKGQWDNRHVGFSTDAPVRLMTADPFRYGLWAGRKQQTTDRPCELVALGYGNPPPGQL